MIDYTHVPAHLRCSDRHKIVDNYPESDARWWELQERRAKAQPATCRADYSVIPAIVMEWYDAQSDGPEIGLSLRIAGSLGIPVRHFYSAMKNWRRCGREARYSEPKPVQHMSAVEMALDPYLRSDS